MQLHTKSKQHMYGGQIPDPNTDSVIALQTLSTSVDSDGVLR